LLLKKSFDVIVVDDLSTGKVTNLNPNVKFLNIDISNKEALFKEFDNLPISHVFHFAAQSSVTVSVKNILMDLHSNIIGTINILDLCEKSNCNLTFSSTGGAIYGDAVPRPTKETDKTSPVAPYGVSKLSAEFYIRSYNERFNRNHSICRLANVYGPRQRPDGEAGVVSIIADKMRRNHPIKLYGHGEATRDYIFVEDLVEGFFAAQNLGGIFNLGTGIETTNLRIFEIIAQVLGNDTKPLLEPLREGEIQHSCLDSSEISKLMNWRPVNSLMEGIRKTLNT
jgi:UDP-glucose 4-epimerase